MNQNNIDDTVRLSFGANWARFLSVLNDERIAEAVMSLQTMLGVVDLNGEDVPGHRFRNGLFSLAARPLWSGPFPGLQRAIGRLHSGTTAAVVKEADWIVEQGSALDWDYMNQLCSMRWFILGACCITQGPCGSH
jgi:hypothetical protein